MRNVLLSRARIALVNKFVVSRLMGNHPKRIIPWLVMVLLLAVSWKFIRLVCYYSSFEEHDVENSIDFKDLLLVTTTGRVIRPRRIRVVNTLNEVNRMVAVVEELMSILQQQDFPVLGMSVEITPSTCPANRQVVMLQFATKDGHCVLFRVNRYDSQQRPQVLPEPLVWLLMHDRIWKVGVNLYEEASYLHNHFNNPFEVKNTYDLRCLAPYADRSTTLHQLATRELGVQENVHCVTSNWRATDLTPDRIFYGAMNAYLGILLFQHFFRAHMQLNDEDLTPPHLDMFFQHCNKMESERQTNLN